METSTIAFVDKDALADRFVSYIAQEILTNWENFVVFGKMVKWQIGLIKALRINYFELCLFLLNLDRAIAKTNRDDQEGGVSLSLARHIGNRATAAGSRPSFAYFYDPVRGCANGSLGTKFPLIGMQRRPAG